MKQKENKNHKNKIENRRLVGMSNDGDDSGNINDNNSNNDRIVVLMIVIIKSFIEYASYTIYTYSLK